MFLTCLSGLLYSHIWEVVFRGSVFFFGPTIRKEYPIQRLLQPGGQLGIFVS